MAPDFAFSCNSSCNKHATIKSELHLCVFCDRCPMSINACNEAGKAKLTVAASIRVLGFVSPAGIGRKVTKVPRAPILLLERLRAVHDSLSCSPWVLLWSRFNSAREVKSDKDFPSFVSKAVERTHND